MWMAKRMGREEALRLTRAKNACCKVAVLGESSGCIDGITVDGVDTTSRLTTLKAQPLIVVASMRVRKPRFLELS